MQRADAKSGVFASPRTSDEIAQAHFHFFQGKRLGKVVVSADLKAQKLVFQRVACGKH